MRFYKVRRATFNEYREGTPGISIEERVRKMIEEKTPIDDVGAEIIFTERKDGVIPGYNIRTDKWDVACDAMDKVAQMGFAERARRIAEREKENNPTPGAEGKSEEGQENPVT